jgi:hypothetical protein
LLSLSLSGGACFVSSLPLPGGGGAAAALSSLSMASLALKILDCR